MGCCTSHDSHLDRGFEQAGASNDGSQVADVPVHEETEEAYS